LKILVTVGAGFIGFAENIEQLCGPGGFSHGFYVTSGEGEFVYKCTDYYNSKFENSIFWSVPDLKIVWPIWNINAKLSVKDKNDNLFGSILPL
jgi:dTDP-4-dehydrorhamnose 3,5-epimerase